MDDLEDIKKLKQINNEYELQKASVWERKLGLLEEERPEYKDIRNEIRAMIKAYEDQIWSDFTNISDELLAESDKAEQLVLEEEKFIKRRKEIIRSKLKQFEMNQQELGQLLGHPKTYMSELMNGLSQFSMKDLVIIHRVFGIGLEKLIPTYIQADTRTKLLKSIRKLNKPMLGKSQEELF